MMGSRSDTLRITTISIVAALLFVVGCKDDEQTTQPPTTTTPLAAVTNVRAFSQSISSVGVTWTVSSDSGLVDLIGYAIKTFIGSTTLDSTTVPKNVSRVTISNLVEGTVYTFEVTALAAAGSGHGASSAVTVQWAPARRLNNEGTIPIKVYEIRSTLGGSGLQFFSTTTGGPRVLPIGPSGGSQGIIDVLLDTLTTTGEIVLESAHLNPLLVGQAKQTRFSTINNSADSLNIGQSAPPDTGTYGLNRVTIGTGAVSAGQIFYAVTSDSHYVRILVQRDPSSGTFLFGSAPDRYITVRLSYQGTPGVRYAKPSVVPSMSDR